MNGLHPLTKDPIPAFIAGPNETDFLFTIAVIFFLVVIFAIGILYLRLHALPEHIAHRSNKVQLQLVAILGLIALFTHNHLFWIAGLLLAFIEFPDISSPLGSIAQSLEKLSGRNPEQEANPSPSSPAEPEPPDLHRQSVSKE